MKNLTKKTNDDLMTIDFEQDAEKGFENTTVDDYTMPIIRIIQSTSEQLDETSEKYIKNAKIGDIYNIATKENYGPVINVVPIAYFKKWIEYTTERRFINAYEYNDNRLDFRSLEKISFSSYKKENGNELVETGYFPVLILKENYAEHAIIAIESTKWKFAKQWLTFMNSQKLPGQHGQMFTPAFFSYIYTIKTITEKNAQGTWKGYALDDSRLIDNYDAYAQAKDMHSKIKDGLISVRHEDDKQESSTTEVTPTQEDLDIKY